MLRPILHLLLACVVLLSACAPSAVPATPTGIAPSEPAATSAPVTPSPASSTLAPSATASAAAPAPTRAPTAPPEAPRPTAIPAPICFTATLPLTTTGEYVTALAAAPERAWAAVYSPTLTRTTIYISDDAGQTWTSARFFSEYVGEIVASPVYTRDRSVFAAGTGGIYRSFNGGYSWAGITPTGWYTTGQVTRHFAVSPAFGVDRLMLLGSTASPRGVYASIDGGVSWRDWLVDAVDGLFISPNYSIDRAVWVSRNDEFTFRRDAMVTASQGDAWEYVHSGSTFPVGVSPAYAQDSTVFWRDLAGGLYVSRNSDRVFPSIVKARADALTIWQQAPGQGWVAAGEYPVRAVVFSPDFGSDRTAFALADPAPLATRDGGATWSPLCYWSANPQAPGAAPFTDLAISPNFATDHTLYAAGAGSRVAVSHDGGRSWILAPLK